MASNINVSNAATKALTCFSINSGATEAFMGLEGADGEDCTAYSKNADELLWFPADDVENSNDPNGATELMRYNDQEFLLLASCGCPNDNRPFCRIMQNTQTGVLMVVFQPLVLAGVDTEYAISNVNIWNK